MNNIHIGEKNGENNLDQYNLGWQLNKQHGKNKK